MTLLSLHFRRLLRGYKKSDTFIFTFQEVIEGLQEKWHFYPYISGGYWGATRKVTLLSLHFRRLLRGYKKSDTFILTFQEVIEGLQEKWHFYPYISGGYWGATRKVTLLSLHFRRLLRGYKKSDTFTFTFQEVIEGLQEKWHYYHYISGGYWGATRKVTLLSLHFRRLLRGYKKSDTFIFTFQEVIKGLQEKWHFYLYISGGYSGATRKVTLLFLHFRRLFRSYKKSDTFIFTFQEVIQGPQETDTFIFTFQEVIEGLQEKWHFYFYISGGYSGATRNWHFYLYISGGYSGATRKVTLLSLHFRRLFRGYKKSDTFILTFQEVIEGL